MRVWVSSVLNWSSWRQRFEQAWLNDVAWVRWGIPIAVCCSVFGLGSHGLSLGDAFKENELQLFSTQNRNALLTSQWSREAALREGEQAGRASVKSWQSGLVWTQAAPWLQWPEKAKVWGVTLNRIQPTLAKPAQHHVQHWVALEGTGDLSNLDAFWRDLGRKGWWVTVQSMRMDASRDGAVNWQAQWAVHEATASDASAGQKGGVVKAEWVKGWLQEGGPSVAKHHESVSVVASVRLDGEWTLATLSQPLRSDLSLPAPWPNTDWTQMRMVGRWVRGQQVVALVAVGGVVHAVVPGMRLGPQQHEVARVEPDGVWIVNRGPGGSARRVLHWVDKHTAEGS